MLTINNTFDLDIPFNINKFRKEEKSTVSLEEECVGD